ncbi:MAG: hypothetical protein ACI9K5_001422 [Gammaproteobacteria bacterium]
MESLAPSPRPWRPWPKRIGMYELHYTIAMSSSPEDTTPHEPESATAESQAPRTPKRVVKTHTPRPDELSKETFEFIAAIDDYKRNHMRSFLDDIEILNILYSLGYGHPEFEATPDNADDEQIERFQDARQRYRDEAGRLFPTWSELFTILTELGYSREELLGQEEPADSAA